LARLIYAVAASAAFCAQAICAPAQAAEPKASVEGVQDPALRAAIVRAVGNADRPIQNRFEARRRAREAAEDAIAVLRSDGYYAYEVTPDVGEGDSTKPVIKVTPGPQFVLASPKIDWVGVAPDAATVAAASAALGLKVDSPGRAVDVISAEGRVVAAVQKRGYADVAAKPREVVVDHADHTVRPTYKIASGPIVRLDGIDFTTNGRTNPAWVKRLQPWQPGEAYDPKDVAELERRLLDTGVYDSVTVALAGPDKTTPDGLRPVVVNVSERKRRTLDLGASYSTTEGFGLDSRWSYYNVFHRADTLALVGRISDIDSKAEVDLSLPDWKRPDQTLKESAGFYRNLTDAYNETGFGVRGDVTRHYSKTSYLTFGASLDLSRTDELRLGTLTPLGRDLVTVGTLGELSLDRSDDPLNPRRGWRVNVRAEPTYIFGQENLPFLKLQSQVSAYLPLQADASTVLAGRLHIGSIINGSVSDIPAPKRFYAGGGGSVRGFGYQDVGPRLSDGTTPQGGLSLVEASLELRQEVTAHWGVVAFVDAGAVGSELTPGFQNLSIGAGLGVRYNLGFGPIRVDIATPVTDRKGAAPIQLYISIGQSF
jgi:translocation and assembly module TamA